MRTLQTVVVMALSSVSIPMDGRTSRPQVAPSDARQQRDAAQDAGAKETLRYVKQAGAEWVFESEVQIQSGKSGVEISSTTGRDQVRLSLTSRFDTSGQLSEASVKFTRDGQQQTARVDVRDATARVTRAGGEVAEFDCPAGVIVTSAPDWTDTVLMAKRYDRKRGGKQEFAGLWIHPTQQPLRLTFSIERLGSDTIEHADKSQSLDRFRIVLRGGSRYIGWGDAAGKLVRLVPENAPQQGIVLDGWEKSTSGLRVEAK